VAHGTSKEAVSRAAGHVIPRTLWNSKYHYLINNRRLSYSPFFILPDGGLLTVLLNVRNGRPLYLWMRNQLVSPYGTVRLLWRRTHFANWIRICDHQLLTGFLWSIDHSISVKLTLSGISTALPLC